MIGGGKILYPPFVFDKTLQEDRHQQRWTPAMRRAMRHGTYPWPKTTTNDRSADGARTRSN